MAKSRPEVMVSLDLSISLSLGNGGVEKEQMIN
jgi:hypothetical protein